MHPGGEVARQDDKTQFYSFLGKTEARVFDVVFTGTTLVCECMTNVLFGLGFTYSYVSIKFSLGFDMNIDVLNAPSMSLPS